MFRLIERERESKKPLKSKLKIFKILSLAVFVFAVFYFSTNSVFAATYYVDSSITDTNVGSATPDCVNYNLTTHACSGGSVSAYKTIADINAFSGLVAGDSILFKRGDIWRESLIVPSSGSFVNPIKFGAYGVGNPPIIRGSSLSTGWVADGNNYKITKPYYNPTWGQTGVFGVWEDNAPMFDAGSVANMRPGTFYWYSSLGS